MCWRLIRLLLSCPFLSVLIVLLPSSSLTLAQSDDLKLTDSFTIWRISPVSDSPEYRTYQGNLSKRIVVKLRELKSTQRENTSKGIVVIGFQLDKDGAIRADSLKILAGSGNESLDALALGSVQSSTPFEAFPDSWGTTAIEFRMNCRFSVLPDGPFRSLYESVQRSANNRDYSTAAQVLESLLDKDPDYTNGWNYLGYIYNQMGQYEKALPALQKAIVQSPFDNYAYNNLGQAFAGLKRFEEAVPQYQKQIEINPKDRFAWANLGRVYIELHQADKALLALQAAVAIAPKDPAVHFNLGRAYAAAHQNEKAVESFQRSVEIEPVPLRWNNVAYQLAQNDLALDQAKNYANSAIAAVAGRLRPVSPETLSNEDLRNTNALASFWDTYGWIRFKQGDLHEAEKYVRSAWLLHSIGEDADHLGQIYEKEGRKSDAITYYTLALASSSPHVESRARLAALIGSDATVDELVEKARPQLTELRTVHIKNTHDLDGVAEFWILLAPGPKVRGAKFITGDEILRPFTTELTSAIIPDFFPEATETQLVRRGRLSCTPAPASQCKLLLDSAESVRIAE